MISLWAIGPYAETFFGKVRYLILYLLSGLCGNLLTVAVELHTGSYALSAGASGAICGLLSVFLIFAMMPQTRRAFPLPRVLAAIALVLLPGLTPGPYRPLDQHDRPPWRPCRRVPALPGHDPSHAEPNPQAGRALTIGSLRARRQKEKGTQAPRHT